MYLIIRDEMLHFYIILFILENKSFSRHVIFVLVMSNPILYFYHSNPKYRKNGTNTVT